MPSITIWNAQGRWERGKVNWIMVKNVVKVVGAIFSNYESLKKIKHRLMAKNFYNREVWDSYILSGRLGLS